jgi:hypothetical protein
LRVLNGIGENEPSRDPKPDESGPNEAGVAMREFGIGVQSRLDGAGDGVCLRTRGLPRANDDGPSDFGARCFASPVKRSERALPGSTKDMACMGSEHAVYQR